MCYSFDITLDLCSEANIRSKVLVLLITLFIVVKCFQVDVAFLLYFICVVCLLLISNKRHHNAILSKCHIVSMNDSMCYQASYVEILC